MIKKKTGSLDYVFFLFVCNYCFSSVLHAELLLLFIPEFSAESFTDYHAIRQ